MLNFNVYWEESIFDHRKTLNLIPIVLLVPQFSDVNQQNNECWPDKFR